MDRIVGWDMNAGEAYEHEYKVIVAPKHLLKPHAPNSKGLPRNDVCQVPTL